MSSPLERSESRNIGFESRPIKIRLKPIKINLKSIKSKVKDPLKPITCNMVRMKHTPKKPKFREPVVTDEMIEKFPKPRVQTKLDKYFTKQMIKDQIRTILLNEREEALEKHRKIRQDERASREAYEREQQQEQHQKQHREAPFTEDQLRRYLEHRERDERKYRIREHRAIIEKEKALREFVDDSDAESERSSCIKQHERSPTMTVINKSAKRFKTDLGCGTPTCRDVNRNPFQDTRSTHETHECGQAKRKLLVQAREIKRQSLNQQWAQIEAGVRREGQEKFISSLYRDLEIDRLTIIHEELMRERMRTKELLGTPNPFLEEKSRAIKRQLADPKLMAMLGELRKCPQNRERLRQSALEMQRAIELYDMIEEDWELDSRLQTATDDVVTSTTIERLPNDASCPEVSSPITGSKYWQYCLLEVNDMDDPEYNALLARFGSKPYYRLVFSGRQTHDPLKTYEQLEKAKKSQGSEYEVARQKFLQILGFHAGDWHQTSPLDDRGVEVSRLHCDRGKEYIGFMRIRCGGHRANKHTPHKMRIVFHLLLGRVCFIVNKRSRTISRGTYFTVDPKSTYSINCLDRNQAAYFVFRISFLDHPESPAQFRDHFDLKDDS